MLEKDLKITRSKFLEGKTSLTDEDIVQILDLPPEKESRTDIKSYTDKNYSDFENDEASLQRLTENLINNSDYLLYRGSYVAKSKLLYEQSVTLCNEIPSLVIGQEIKESFYLLPYGYAMDSNQNFKQFADILDKRVFTDIKRIYGESLRNNFKKAHKQGKNVFFFICNEKLDSKECENEIKKCVYNRKEIKDKTAKYYFYVEKSKQCLIFDFDSKGKLLKKKKFNIDLKKIKLPTNEELKVVRGRMQSIPSGTLKTISDNEESVNNFFNSLLLRGEVEMFRNHKELQKYDSKYLNCLEVLDQITNKTQSELLQNSNKSFIQSEKDSQFYKNLIKNKERNVALINKTQGEKTMPGEKQIIAEIGFADGEIRQYEDSVPFLKDLNEATRENAYDTNFRVYADSDELKQKAADVKLDNYDPIEAAERMHNGYEWNDVEHEAVQFTQSAEGRRLLKDAENGRLTMLDARDILDAVEKNGMTLRYDPLPNSYVVDGWTAADGEKLDNYVVSMSELKRLAGIEISENSQQNQIQEKKTARTPEEEQAYQEWLEMLEDNQKAEEIIEKNHQREPVSLNPEEQGKEDFEEYIHSSEFIDKFGDWEKAARINKLMQADTISKDGKVIIEGEDVTEEINQLRNEKDSKILRIFAKDIGRIVKGTYHNNDLNIDVTLSMSNIDEIKNHHMAMSGHLEAIQYIPEIIQKGIFIAEEPNEDKAKHPNIEKYKYFVCGLNIGKIDFTCKSAIGVDKDGNHYYDQRLSQIEKGLLIDNLSQLMSRGKLEKSLLKYDKRLLRICQCPQSLYLDENLLPTKETVEAVKDGKLYLEKDSEGFQLLHDERTNQIVGKELSDAIQKMPEQLIFASTGIGQMVERLTGKQLGTVNPTRENEIFAPPTTTISQNTENSINYHGLTLTKKDNNLIEPAYDVLLISGIDDKTDSKLIEMLDNTAKWDQYCVLNNSENYIPAIAAEIVAKEKEVKNENVNKSFIEKVQDLKAKVSKSLKKNVAVGVALTSILSANPNLFAQEKPVKLPSEQTILKEAAKEKENLLKTYKDKSPEELLKLLLEANEEKTAAKIQASNLEKSVKELEVRNTNLEFYKDHYKTKSATQENFYDEMKKTQDMYESLKRSSQQDHDILYKHAKIVVNGQERVCHTGLVDGFKNCVTRLDKSLKLNKELVRENKELRKIINQSNQNERNGVSY